MCFFLIYFYFRTFKRYAIKYIGKTLLFLFSIFIFLYIICRCRFIIWRITSVPVGMLIFGTLISIICLSCLDSFGSFLRFFTLFFFCLFVIVSLGISLFVCSFFYSFYNIFIIPMCACHIGPYIHVPFRVEHIRERFLQLRDFSLAR